MFSGTLQRKNGTLDLGWSLFVLYGLHYKLGPSSNKQNLATTLVWALQSMLGSYQSTGFLFLVKSQWSLGEKKHGEILFTLKAFNGRVVTEWLSECARQAVAGPFEDERLEMTHLAMYLSCLALVASKFCCIECGSLPPTYIKLDLIAEVFACTLLWVV